MAVSKSGANKDSDNGAQDPREQASEYVEGINNEYMNAFRDLLNQYIEALSTDISEIAEGLNLSRPVVTAFMNETRNDLPLSIGSICHLHKTLTDTERVGLKRISNKKSEPEAAKSPSIKKLRAEAIKQREDLAKKGPDELLITAGFQPRKMKMVPVSPQQYSQLSFISYLYKDRPLSQDLFFQIAQQEVDRRALLMREPAESTSKESKIEIDNKEEIDIPLQELKNNTWMNKKDKSEIERKYRSAIEKINKTLTSHERAGLLASVLHNQLNKSEEINFRLRVVRVERIPLSHTWEYSRTGEFKILWDRIEKLSTECENNFLGISNGNGNGNGKNYPTHQLTRTIVTCASGENGVEDEFVEDEINFEYISTGTHSRTAISAIFLNLGLYNFMPTIKFDIKSFEEDISSLVKALVIIKPNSPNPDNNTSSEESYLGEWVSSDLIQSIIQATVVASKKLLKQKIGSNSEAVDLYKKLVKLTSKLRARFYKYRIAFDGYDFNDGIVSIKKFKDIEKKAQDCKNEIEKFKSSHSEKESTEIWNNFLSNFYRLFIGSLLYRLIHENIKFNHGSCKDLLEKIDKQLSEIEGNGLGASKLLIPSKISLIAEKIAYNLSFGLPVSYIEFPDLREPINIFQTDNVLSLLNKIDEKVDEYLKEYVDKNKSYNDPGYDIHYSLGSYYSITGRVLLYKASNENEINSACDRLFKSIYYFHRIGLTRKVERNLTLVGRVKVRSKKDDYVEPCKRLSEIILTDSLSRVNAPRSENFELSMRSRLNSLSGEHSFIMEENRQAALVYALQALRGALWLGLNRHTADNLYTIARCAKGLEGIRIKEYLENNFPQLYRNDRSNELFVHSPKDNAIALKVVDLLFDMAKPENENKCWSDVWKKFRDASANIWNTWHRNATGDKNAKHPFAIQIEKMEFLEPIDRP
jgi:hypothetical protein